MAQPSPTDLYRRATTDALAGRRGVRPDQLDLPDTVLGVDRAGPARPPGRRHPLPRRRHRRHRALRADRHDGRRTSAPASTPAWPGSPSPARSTRTCTSPLGFEWTVQEATAGTFMDVLIHTWDLATATGQTADLDPELVDACVADVPARHARAGPRRGHRRPRRRRRRRRRHRRPGCSAAMGRTP